MRRPSGEIATPPSDPPMALPPRSRAKRVRGRSGLREALHHPAKATAAISPTAATSPFHLPGVRSFPASATMESVSASSITSPISRNRLRGSFSRQAASSRRTETGTCPRFASRVSTAASASAVPPPPNNRSPVTISQRTTPNAHISARLSTLSPRACSGLIYPGVPRIMPSAVTPSGASCEARDLARPKSKTLTEPSGLSLMLAGFRSRWTMPCSCAASSAAAI